MLIAPSWAGLSSRFYARLGTPPSDFSSCTDFEPTAYLLELFLSLNEREVDFNDFLFYVFLLLFYCLFQKHVSLMYACVRVCGR